MFYKGRWVDVGEKFHLNSNLYCLFGRTNPRGYWLELKFLVKFIGYIPPCDKNEWSNNKKIFATTHTLRIHHFATYSLNFFISSVCRFMIILWWRRFIFVGQEFFERILCQILVVTVPKLIMKIDFRFSDLCHFFVKLSITRT